MQIVGGANVIGQLPRAGLVDELHIDVKPVLLGDGPRLFALAAAPSVGLEEREVQEAGQRTGLRFRVIP